MFPGMNPKKMEQMLKKLGMKMDNISAKEVIIKTDSGDIKIENPQVVKTSMKGQVVFQISGNVREQVFSDEDVKLVIEQSGIKDEEKVKDAIVRLQIVLPAEVEGQLRDNDIRNAVKEAHYFTVAKDIKRETRLRLGKWTAEEITPLEALKAYLESKKIAPERAKLLLEYGEKIIQERR